jgi:hypothetical protein
MSDNTLGYVGKAIRSRHGWNGLRYIHRWATGAQELIFSGEDQAARWAERETREGRPTKVTHAPKRGHV